MTVWTRGDNPWLKPCAEPGCENKVQKGKSNLCPDHQPLICICLVAHADGIGQCVKCWRPIVSLHPVLDDGKWPGIDGQIVVPAAKRVAS